MSHEFDAIFEDGVFRPVQPVDLPERTKVHLQMIPTTVAGSQEVSEQRTAMANLITWVQSQIEPDAADVVSAHDHDRILYGWQK